MLTGREEAEATLSRKIDEFLDELKQSYDDDLVDKKFERELEKVQLEDDKEILKRVRTLLGELDVN
jgi:hypothetical protein